MLRFLFFVGALAGSQFSHADVVELQSGADAPKRPNILFIIADDASRHFGRAYHCDWVKTPNIDRLAREGLVFDNAYVATSKCAPCRAAILTGRNPWQLEEAGNHQAHFPPQFAAFGEALKRSGVHSASAGKVWGPGSAKDKDGRPRDFGLPSVKGKAKKTVGGTLAAHLETRPANSPFFFWYGSSDPHRAYEAGSGMAAGKKLSDIDRVPRYWPDNDIVRSDMLDYAIEVERFDAQVGELLKVLDDSGEAQNTLVIVTSDHGMPFPRVKGHTYDEAHHVPLVMCWPNGIAKPGRRVTEFISCIDFAPTILELMGVSAAESGLEPITGRSLTDLLWGEPKTDRPFAIIGRERNDVFARRGSEYGLGYPTRGIRQGDFLYVRNFAPERWPCGDADLGLKDTDASPTKKFIEERGPDDDYWQHAFGKRPAEQLFNLANDPDCVDNLIENPGFAKTRNQLSELLMAELKKQADPRVLGNGDVFERYPSTKKVPADWEATSPSSTKPDRQR